MRIIRNKLDQKIKLLFYVTFIFILIIILRLLYLQIYLNEKLFNQSTRNFTRIQKIILPRGNIVDTNNQILVTNRPVNNLYWTGTSKKNLTEEQFELLTCLEKIININSLEIKDKIKFAEKCGKSVLLANDISYEQLSKIVECFPDNNNLSIETKFQRFYPHKNIASHIVGYLSQIDCETIGKMGLEKIFEDELKGEPGQELATINSFGKKISKQEIKPPKPGKELKLTLDFNMQKIAEAVFPEEFKGTLIIMDPETGGIKTLISRPNFDPSIFLKQLTSNEWNTLQNEQPFLNRSCNACYPPASIFKLVTTTAALETGIISEDSKWNCKGFVNFYGDKNYLCAKQRNHGLISIKEAVAMSCNTFFYNLAKKLHVDTIAKYAKKFGLNEKTGIMFAEKKGLIPTAEWKMQNFSEPWWPGETLSVAIGQSYLLVTPMQIARLISSIFTGYLVNPRILESEEIKKTQLTLKNETFEFLKQSMKTAVTTGTGQMVNKIKDITVYAKTGTAQTGALNKRDVSAKFIEHTWFVSNFAYKNQKSFTMVILIEHAGSTTVPINAARRFLLEYRKFCRENEDKK